MSKTLLLADDSVTIQRVVELTFAHEDVRIVSMSDGERAMEWLASGRADVVLVDVGIPEVDGYTIAEHVKTSKKHKGVPVLLMAGAFEPVDEDRSRQIGCDGVIVKPFEPQHLVERVRELLGRGNGRQEPEPEPVVPDRRKHQPAAPAGIRQVMAMPSPAGPSIEELQREAKPKTTQLPPAAEPAAAEAVAPVAAAGGESTTGGLPSLDALRARRDTRQTQARIDEQWAAASPAKPIELELPERPLWQPEGPAPAPQPPPAPPAEAKAAAPAEPKPKVTLVNAFTALLAAEKSAAPARTEAAPAPAAAISDAAVEDAVRRALVKMTDDLVRRLVLETAERLIKEEIEKIKADPE